ncbi:hypothetical protein Tco_1020805, partial [Tanacetum coccineum]
MTSITAQQTKLDLELIYPRVPGRDFDALHSKEDTISFLRDLGHIGVINSLNDVVIDQMHQPWRTFAAIINKSLSGKTSGLDKLRLSRVQILWGMYHQKYVDYVELLWEDFTYQIDNKVYKKQENIIGMHTSKADYLINTLRFVSRKEASQIYGAVLPECLTSPEMKESKVYKTYLGYATGEVVPKVARKFKKASLSKKESELVPGDEEPVKKGKRLKTPAKKSASKPATCIVIREPPIETKSKRKEKEKVDVAHGKGIELLSEVALSEKTQMKEVRKKSLRDFHKTHPSSSGMVAEKPPSVEKITPTVTSEGTGDKPGVLDVTNDDSSKSESKYDEMKSDEEQGMDERKLETTQEQVVEDAHVTISTITKKTEVPITSSSHSSDLAFEFLNFSDIPHTDVEIVSLLDVHVHHEVLRTQAPTLLKIPVSIITESSHGPLHTQVTTLVDEHLDTRLGETREEFMNFLSESLMARIKEQVKDQLPQILPKEVSNFAPPVIEALIKESRDEVTLAKVTSQPHSTYEAASTLTEFELKKILIHKMEKSESYLAAPEHRDCYDSLKKSYNLDKDLFFSYDVYSLKRSRKDKDKDEDPYAGSDRWLKKGKLSKDAEPTTGPKKKDSTSSSSKDSDMPQDQEGNLGDNEDETRNETASRRDWFKKPTPPQEPTDHDWYVGKTTQEGPTQNWLMTLAASTSTDKSLKDFDELMITPINFSGYILNGLQIKNLTQAILLGPAFRLLKGTRSNFAELEYDFEECYKALSEKLDWENPKGGDYPFDIFKPLPLIKHGKRQRVPFEFFINNDLK